jgi:outer membrane protein assembly factor BamA
MRYSLLVLLLCLAFSSMGQDDNAPVHASPCSRSASIHSIVVTGNQKTHTSVILRELNVQPGSSVCLDSLRELELFCRQRIYNLQLFNEVDVHFQPDSAGQLYATIRVKERWFIIPTVNVQFADRNFNTWFVTQHHDLRRAIAGITLTDKNFRGNLETLALTVQEGYIQKIGITYMRPYINKSQKSGLGFSFAYTQGRQAYFATDSNKFAYAGLYSGPVIQRQYEGGISYSYRPAYASRHILQLNYRNLSVGDTILRLNPEYFAGGSTHASFAELFYRYEYNGVDNWNYSLSGYKLVANASIRKGIEGLRFQSFAMVEAGMFHQLAPKWFGSCIFRGRLMLPQDQPYFFRSGLGTQTDYVRGYEYFIIDGGHYGLVRFDLKRELFNSIRYFNIRYFSAAPIRIYPKIFADAGYINSPSPGNSFLSNRLLYSVGAGVDIVTIYDIKIRLEYTRNHLNQNGLYLHFNSE